MFFIKNIDEKHSLLLFKYIFITICCGVQHTDPDYSCAYVTIKTNGQEEGYGLTFTCGRGTEIVQQAAIVLGRMVVGRRLRQDIYARFGDFWRELTSETQLRWVIFTFSLFLTFLMEFR